MRFCLKSFPLFAAALTALASAGGLFGQSARPANAADYSTQPYVVERLSHSVQFENDGTYREKYEVRVRVQSASGVQSWGLIRFPYASSNGRAEFANVRVTKPDGTIVNTTVESTQDMPARITVAAPFYSDLKEKQLAVRGLAIGDTLEYEQNYNVTSASIPGHFWYARRLFRPGIVLSEEISFSVPAARYAKVKSPLVEPVTSEAGGYRIYTWKIANPDVQKPDENQDQSAASPDIQLTSFRSWDEIATWYRQLQDARVVPTPAIRAKAAELTQSATNESEKIRVLYDYVSLKFRYIGIAFGIGRYQPHMAEEVLENGYGDCKDKHTLLAALLAAAGVKAFPALVHSGQDLDPDIPSPAQFDHAITVVQQGKQLLWLDTTPEVAPFGLLIEAVRDKYALLVSDTPSIQLVRTPADPPFGSLFRFQMSGRIGDDGALEAKADVTVRGDAEVIYRGAFRNTPETQWKALAQSISQSWAFAGTVDDVSVSPPDSTREAFQIRYAYTRKNYSRWPDAISPPMPPINVSNLSDEAAKNARPIHLESPGEYLLDAKVELPAGVTPRLRLPVEVKQDFAQYKASYSMEGNVLHAERRLTIQMREIPKARSEEYRAFRKAVEDDGDATLSLVSAVPTGSASGGTSVSSSAAEHINLGDILTYQDDYEGAIAQYRRALQLEPDNFRAHHNLGDAFYFKEDYDGALAEYRQAMRLRPNDPEVHDSIGSALLAKNDLTGAVTEYRESLRFKPDDSRVRVNLGRALSSQRKWDEALVEYKEALRLDPKSARAQRGIGSLFYDKGDFTAAATAYRESIKLEPGNANAYEWLGDTLFRAGDVDAAIAALREAARLDPKSLYARTRIGNIFHNKREYDSAIAAYHEALQLEPTDPQALRQLGDALAAKGEVDAAIASFREAARSNPSNAITGRMASTRIGDILVQNKRFAEAITELQDATEKYPQEAGLWFRFGAAKVRSGRATEGLVAIEKSLALAPSPVMFNNAAWELADSGVLLDDALRYAEKAVSERSDETADMRLTILTLADTQLMGGLAAFWDTLGWVYFRRGNTEEAEKYLSAAWKLSQRTSLADHLGQLYEQIGDKQRALHHFALALAVPGPIDAASETRNRLVALSGSAAKADDAINTARNELSEMRTAQLPRVVPGAARAEYFILFSSGAVAATRFISGSEELRNAGDALVSARHNVLFPDDRPTKIVRRGILDCPATGTNCQFILLPTESVTSVD